MIYIKALMVFIIYLMSYYLLGFAIAKLCRVKHIYMVNSLITGFWAEGLLFFIFIMPFKVKQARADVAAWIWLGVWLAVMAAIIIVWHKSLYESLKGTLACIAHNRIFFGVIGAVIVAMLVYEMLYGNYTDGSGSRYFVGSVTSDIFTNKFGVLQPDLGSYESAFNSQYFLQTNVHHSAVVCIITGLAPLVEQRTVMSSIVILMSGLIIMQMACTIFKKSRKRALFFWLAYNIFIMMLAHSVYIPAYYLFYRAFEGKTIFGMLLIPYVFTCFWRLYERPVDNYTLTCLVVALLGSYTFCMSTMYVLPFLLIGYLPVSLVQRRLRQLVNWCIMMIPCVLVIGYYILVLKGIIDLTIR